MNGGVRFCGAYRFSCDIDAAILTDFSLSNAR